MSKVLLSTHGTNGDVLPFIDLAEALRDRGHDVLLMTHAPFARLAERRGVPAHAIDTDEDYERHVAEAGAVLRQSIGGFDAAGMLEFYRRNRFFEINRAEFDTIAERHVPGDTVVVGRHTSGLAALLARERLGVPAVWVALTPTQYGTLPISEFTHAEVLGGAINEMRAGLGLPPVRHWGDWLRSADAQIGLWPDWYDRAGTPSPDGVELVGFVVTASERTVPPEVAAALAGEPPVLVSGTTGKAQNEQWYAAAVGAAVASGRRVLVATPYQENVPDQFADQVSWFPRLPFAQVLPQVAALIHHGGIGTTGAAAAAGVPQVVLAQGLDQPDNGARVMRSGLGTWLPAARWTPSAVGAALRRALSPAGRPTGRYEIDTAAALTAACARIESTLALQPALH